MVAECLDTTGIWTIKANRFQELSFIMELLIELQPDEFYERDSEILTHDDILIQMKDFFLNRNLDGKALFRVLTKQA